MKNLLVGITLLASMSAFADPILPCDQNELGTLLQAENVQTKALEINDNFAVYSITMDGREAVVTLDRDCDFWDLEIIDQ